ncbi:MAG: UDP-N-acetylmuramoyl-tripeptide--D-alanyl-D-alanine ligase [Proteobacteria bacterium]|nr:MAG: UDP-N-acetylmuramoyl-tripeptide--D-alanyl-D-alanine ligase [Pseudomonadota bacterium]
MTWLMLTEVADLCGARLHGTDTRRAANIAIERVERDSRQVQLGDLFLALKGERFDAHDFVTQVAGRASAALVSRAIEADIPQLLVDDVRLALGRFAAGWRQRYQHPVIGLTGSNGKTTLKEMLSAILSVHGQTLATMGNLNNDIGMPLTLLRLREADQFAVIEMGANHFGEIDYLTRIACPDVAILNNAGAAHLEGFGDIAGVARAKGEIFNGLSDSGIAIINADDIHADYWLGLNLGREVVSFGMDVPADMQGINDDKGFMIHCTRSGQAVSVKLKLLGRHNQMNALAAAAAAYSLGLSLESIRQGLESIQAIKGRLCPHKGIKGSLVVDDTYNANPASVAAAINVLADMPGNKILVLGNMAELGEAGLDDHKWIGRQAAAAGINTLFTLGALSQYAANSFGAGAQAFKQLDDLLLALKPNLASGTKVLVKGSRSARMERVVAALIEQPEQTCKGEKS